MHPFLKRLEHFTDKSIPYWLVLLLIIIILEFFFKEIASSYQLHINIADYLIIVFFTLDLGFKFHRVRSFKPFLKKYWLDIIAVFPFFLLFRLVDELILFFRLGAEVSEGQRILHSSIELEKIVKEERALRELAELQKESRVFREIQESSQLVRTQRFARIFRLPRLVKVFPFYEKPIEKELKTIKRKLR